MLSPIDVCLNFLYGCLSYLTCRQLLPPQLSVTLKDFMMGLNEEYSVSLLTNFISAHEYAQSKVSTIEFHSTKVRGLYIILLY